MKRIIWIDDDIGFYSSHYEKLRSAGYDVELCTTIEEGWDAVMQANPDLLIMDIMMPTGSGGRISFEESRFGVATGLVFLQKLLAHEEVATKVLIFSVMESRILDDFPDVKERVDDYVEKPELPSILLEHVHQMLSRDLS